MKELFFTPMNLAYADLQLESHLTIVSFDTVSAYEPRRGHNAPVPPGGSQDPATHPAPLLRVQGHLGLGHTHTGNDEENTPYIGIVP